MKIRVSFERIGRRHDVPDLDVTVSDDIKEAGDDLADAVYAYAKRFLASRYPDVDVLADGRVLIGWGRMDSGTWAEVVRAA